MHLAATTCKKYLILAADGLLILLLVFGKQIVTWMHTYIPPCAFYEKGLLCPACGSTRSMGALFRGDIVGAFLFHPYVFCLTIFAGLCLLTANLAHVANVPWAKRIGAVIFRGTTVIVLAAGFAIFGVGRMIFF